MKKYRLLLAVLALLAGSALIFRQLRIAHKLREEMATSRRLHTDLLGQLEKAHQALARTHPIKDKLKTSRGQTQAKAAGDAESENNARRQQILKWVGASLGLHYASLYRKLGLSPEQIDQYERLELDFVQSVLDIQDTAGAQNIPGNDPALGTLVQKELQQFQQSATALLGQSAMQDLAQFDRTSPARTVATAIAGNVYYTDTPLTPEQGDKLTQIFANNSASYQNGGMASLNNVNVAAALAQAQAILSPAQLTALQNFLQGRTAWSSLQARITALTAPSAAPAR